jgi:hypothetical protein
MTAPLPLLAFISDDILDGSTTFKTITIRWKRGSKMPTIRGQWIRLPDGRIEAIYTRDELAQCLKIFELTNLLK